MVFTKQDHIISLTKSNFNSSNTLKHKYGDVYDVGTGFTIILFYAEWCGHCKNFKPLYVACARVVCCNSNICAVDCSNDSEIQKLVNSSSSSEKIISGYPTVLRYKDGKYVDKFESTNTFSNLKKFMLGL